jgi:hypothetical protein
MLQLNPPLPIITPFGPGVCHFLIDPGLESSLQWVVIQSTGSHVGECWTWQNEDVRFEPNATIGRGRATPLRQPPSQHLAFPKFPPAAPRNAIGRLLALARKVLGR